MAKAETTTETKTETPELAVTLAKPITVGGSTYSKLPYREATGRDMRKAYNTPKYGDRILGLLVDVFELPDTFWDAVPAPVFMAAKEVVDNFFETAQPA
jgi:hypothetical protein